MLRELPRNQARPKNNSIFGNIVEKLHIPQSVASQQLGLMKDKQVLQCRREGTKSYYSIKNSNVISLLHCVYHNCEHRQDDVHTSEKGKNNEK